MKYSSEQVDGLVQMSAAELAESSVYIADTVSVADTGVAMTTTVNQYTAVKAAAVLSLWTAVDTAFVF